MTAVNLPPVDLLRKLLDYDPATGYLTWKTRTPDLFQHTGVVPQEITCRRWNTARAGKRADSRSGNGYHQVNLSGKCLSAHRVIWAIHYGAWPTSPLDHINGVRCDNRVENMRACTPSGNSRNTARRSDNRSSCTGVHRRGRRWIAQISTDGGRVHLGSFAVRFDAVLARLLAERAHGYTVRHGV